MSQRHCQRRAGREAFGRRDGGAAGTDREPEGDGAIESGSRDPPGPAKLATLLDDRLKALAFKTERRKAAAGAGADIVIGTRTGTGTRRIMMQAHMDTVYESGIPKS